MLKLIRGKSASQITKDLARVKKPLLTQMGVEAVDFVMKNFRQQGYSDGSVTEWAKREPRAARNDKRALLGDKGALRRSIRILRRGEDSILVGSQSPYAKAHNEGAEFDQVPTAKQRRFFWAMYYKNKKKASETADKITEREESGKKITKRTEQSFDKSKQHIEGLDSEAAIWKNMAMAKKLHIKIPKRQFIGYSKTLQTALDKLLKTKIDEIFK